MSLQKALGTLYALLVCVMVATVTKAQEQTSAGHPSIETTRTPIITDMTETSSGRLVQDTNMTNEEKLVRRAYMRLIRYQHAAADEQAAKHVVTPGPAGRVSFRINRIHTGPIEEIEEVPFRDFVTPPTNEILMVVPSYYSLNGGPRHLLFQVSWTDGYYTEYGTVTVRDALAQHDRFNDVGMYTSYEVAVRLENKERTYKALALHHRRAQSVEREDVDFLDNVVGSDSLVTALTANLPVVKAPWDMYKLSPLYRAYVDDVKNSRVKTAITPDTPLGYLPGDDVRITSDKLTGDTLVMSGVTPASCTECRDYELVFSEDSAESGNRIEDHNYSLHSAWSKSQGKCTYHKSNCTIDCRVTLNDWGFWMQDCKLGYSTTSGLTHYLFRQVSQDDGHGVQYQQGAACGYANAFDWKACTVAGCAVHFSIGWKVEIEGTGVSGSYEVSSDGLGGWAHKVSVPCPAILPN